MYLGSKDLVPSLGKALVLIVFAAGSTVFAATPARHAYFGGLHVHTAWSVDTYPVGLLTTPEDAYRFARGEPITHVTGEKILLTSGPLDFLAVTDHSEYLGMGRTLTTDKDSPLYKTDIAKQEAGDDITAAVSARMALVKSVATARPLPELTTPKLRSYPWDQIIQIADRYNEPHQFTTFVGFEWTSQPERANLHRVVLFGSNNGLPDYPISALDTEDPQELWNWLDTARANGAKALAIPHNSNLSDGRMFPARIGSGKPARAYAEQRIRNEPLTEIMQVKGASETHPALSPNDEWADFAINERMLGAGKPMQSSLHGSYVREAWLNGLILQQALGVNPYDFGVIGASDTHSTAGTYEEGNYFGSKGADDATPELRLDLTDKTPAYANVGRPVRQSLEMRMARNGAGLAGIWAEENTRTALFAALERKETFGTSGPRIRIRLFGGWDFAVADVQNEKTMANAGYARGTAMGGILQKRPAKAGAPVFMLAALMDPSSAPLQRMQIIKGWLENGEAKEIVYDVICASGNEPDSKNNRCPDTKASVDLADCSYPHNTSLPGMSGIWRDPDFDPSQPAFYYARVLENPTCRWSTWDAVRLGIAIPEFAPATIQERAWSSPIWYQVE